MNQDISPL